jgi:CRISPR-associated protein Cas1
MATDAISIDEKVTPRGGVITLYGYGIDVRVDRGHLVISDGIAGDRRQARLPRVNHGLRRLVVIGNDGSVSLAAIRWLADQGASLTVLERDGKVLVTTGPVSASDARMRRAQACANHSEAAVFISRELIRLKLAGQEDVARNKLKSLAIADTIAGFRTRLDAASDVLTIRTIEAQAGQAYWSGWRNVPVAFPKSELSKIPEHWRSFGTRQSPLSSGPRRASTPGNAILNYLSTLLESETRLAAAALGLDVGLGLLHVDAAKRDSLACDLMEPIRPKVEAYLFDWITRTTMRREWFFELSDGNCRLMGSFAIRLCDTIQMWRREVEPLVEWFAETIAATSSNPGGLRDPGTRLTQRRWREATGYLAPAMVAPAKPHGGCRICGQPVSVRRNYCPACTITKATEHINSVREAGCQAAYTPEARAKLGDKQREQNVARRAWNPADQPEWLDIDAYLTKVQPLLARMTRPAIAAALDVSIKYAGDVRAGTKVPHPRHWKMLAELAGITG